MGKLDNLYWVCGRCQHRWKKKNPQLVYESDQYQWDNAESQWVFIPPKESCPNCGRRYNIRYILDAKEGRGSKKEREAIGNHDPWNGEEMKSEIKRCAKG